MIKIVGAVASGALATGTAGYSYLQRVQAETEHLKADNTVLQQKVDTYVRKLHDQSEIATAQRAAIDSALKALRTVQTPQ